MEEKLTRLLRFHRQRVFDTDTVAADRHERALRRLIRTRTYRAMCEANRERQEHAAGQRLLYTYA
jgi:hypothetical protein